MAAMATGNGLTIQIADRDGSVGLRGNLKLDEPYISDPKSEISDWTGPKRQKAPEPMLRKFNLGFRISDLRCRIRPISKWSSRDSLHSFIETFSLPLIAL